jgi:hypothetical protein
MPLLTNDQHTIVDQRQAFRGGQKDMMQWWVNDQHA